MGLRNPLDLLVEDFDRILPLNTLRNVIPSPAVEKLRENATREKLVDLADAAIKSQAPELRVIDPATGGQSEEIRRKIIRQTIDTLLDKVLLPSI